MLHVDGLQRAYGAVRALDGMSFTVEPGVVTGFLGPNGAGKTTTMRAIFGLTELDAGVVRWHGQPVDRPARRQFGYLPEERGLYPGMRVGDQLRYLGQLRGISADEAARRTTSWLERLGLADRIDSNLEDLSLGNQQRVQLIGALVHEPDLLVLDEPFSGLDPVAVATLSDVLRSEAQRGSTVLFSSHQLDLVEDICEAAVIVDHGRAVATGTLDSLTAGAEPALVIAVPSDPTGAWTTTLDDERFTVLGVDHGVVRLGLGADVDPSQTMAERAAPALDAARAAGAVERFGVERKTLAEVFLSIVGHAVDEPADSAVATDDLETIER